jgi:hypothetical protein
MKLYETSLRLKMSDGPDLLESFRHEVEAVLAAGTLPIRFVVTKSDGTSAHVELGILESGRLEGPRSIFEFSKRRVVNESEFNAVMLVPTGIGARIGGHAGDASPVAKMLAAVCDNLVIHPNVVNASDINEMAENTLYVEGSVISRLLMGTIGLQKTRSNRVLAVIEKHPTDELFVNGAINAVNAARAAAGLDATQILVLDPAMRLITEYSPSGRAVGRVDKLDNLFDCLIEMQHSYDSIALSSVIKIPSRALHRQYFESHGKMINPWGGVEAILTHAISSLLNVQSAHSPMIEDQLVSNMDVGVVDARLAAEAISFTYMQCILKGLQRAPRIVTDEKALNHHSVLTVSDVSCLVIPDGCIGIPTLAALMQGIYVIAVRENTNIMQNDLTLLPWAPGQLIKVDSYLEALGVMAALKAGVALDTVRASISNAEIVHNARVLAISTSLKAQPAKIA